MIEITQRLATLRQTGQHATNLQDVRSRYPTAQERAHLARERARDAALRERALLDQSPEGDSNP